jgi:signal transduction histidine kinase
VSALKVVSVDSVKVKLWNRMSEELLLDNPDSAMIAAKQGLAIAQKAHYKRGEAFSLYQLANVCIKLGQDSQAISFLQKNISIWQEQKQDELTAQSYTLLSKIYINVADFSNAIKVLKNCLEISKKTHNSQMRLYTINTLGVCYYYMDKFSEALDYYFLGLEENREFKDNLIQGKFFTNIGLVYRNLDDYESALKYYNLALGVLENEKDKKGLANCLGNIGEIYYQQGKDSLSLLYHQRELKIAEESGDEYLIGNSLSEIALLYKNRLCDNSLALLYFQKELTQRKQAGDKYYEAYCLMNLGDFYDSLEQKTQAFSYYTEALEIVENIGSEELAASLFSKMAIAYYRIGKLKEATDYAIRALAVAQENDFTHEVLLSAKTLANVYKSQGNVAKFLYYKEIETEANDKEKQELITRIKTIYELERKSNAKIEKLNEERLEQKAEIKRQRMIQIFLLIAFVLLVVIGFIVFKNYEIKRDANFQLAAKNEELHELNHIKDKIFFVLSHDLRGPLCSLRGALNLMEMDILPPEQIKKLISGLVYRFNEASNLMDNVLYWASIQLDELRAIPEELSVEMILEDCMNDLIPIAARKEIHLITNIQQQTSVFADKHLLILVMKNLIFNAIKYSHNKSEIHISNEKKGDFEVICIADTGIGISQEIRNKLFEFQYEPALGTAGEKGVGIGLMLSKLLIEKNGGTINIESTENQGTKIYFTIPSLKK